MKELINRYTREPLALTMAEAPWFAYLFSVIIIAAIVNLATGVINTWLGPLWTVILLLGLLAVTLVFANAYAHRVRRQIAQGSRIISGKEAPSLRRGLFVAISTPEIAQKAIEYHAERLEHAWLVATPEKRQMAVALCDAFAGKNYPIHILELADAYDAAACYQLVADAVHDAERRLRMPASDIIVDLTGGTKLITVGMALAGMDCGCALQYVPTQYVADQEQGPYQPILLLLPDQAMRTERAVRTLTTE